MNEFLKSAHFVVSIIPFESATFAISESVEKNQLGSLFTWIDS